MHPYEVLEVLHSSVVERAPRVHALDDGRHVAEDHRVHQGCIRQRDPRDAAEGEQKNSS